MRQAHSILDRRRAGVLLHITSLPGGLHNGELGKEAFGFIDQLVDMGMTVWQTLPINPTHGDGSPYQCLSAHAGNPLLIDPETLVHEGWLESSSSRDEIKGPQEYKRSLLDAAFEGFVRHGGLEGEAFRGFREAASFWLDDYALFMAIREKLGGCAWTSWPLPIRQRDPGAMEEIRSELRMQTSRVEFEQFVFFRQWHALKRYANQRGILLFGDVPIFVAGDSADVWAHQSEFDLLPDGAPRVVAGVPPDYFSKTGQRWGNPHYRWDAMEASGFQWWRARFRSQFDLFDWVRIDHFRGLEAYWEIPLDEETAMGGHWVKAPGEALLHALFEDSPDGTLPLIAENLGIITPEVEALRERFEIPGMLILQFAFDGGADNPYLPKNHTPNQVVYTGTHDNDTTLSWFEGLSDEARSHVYQSLGSPGLPMPEALIRAALDSVALLAILPMQDLLGLGAGSRMNTPGTTEGNWCWRYDQDALSTERCCRIASWVQSSHR